MSDLAGWVRQLIEARKATAEKATQGEWDLDGGSITNGHPVDQIVDWVYERADGEHIVENQPRDVIAQCEADLLTLDRCERVINADWGDRDETGHFITVPIASRLAREMVHLLAWGYRHRDLAGYTAVAGDWQP